MMRVADCMSQPVVTVHDQVTVGEALEQMAAYDVCHLAVTAYDRLVGVVCRCDVSSTSIDHPIRHAMASPPIVILPDATVEHAATLMREAEVGCLLVVCDGQVVGIVARSDLARAGVDPVSHCACCHSTRHVRTHQGMPHCLDCLLQAQDALASDSDDLGVGD